MEPSATLNPKRSVFSANLSERPFSIDEDQGEYARTEQDQRDADEPREHRWPKDDRRSENDQKDGQRRRAGWS